MNLAVSETYTCSVADQCCDAPANGPDRTHPLPQCFGCGQDVCVKCSSMRVYEHFDVGNCCRRGAREVPVDLAKRHSTAVRLCNGCQVERLDGGSQRRVLLRICRMIKASPYDIARIKQENPL